MPVTILVIESGFPARHIFCEGERFSCLFFKLLPLCARDFICDMVYNHEFVAFL